MKNQMTIQDAANEVIFYIQNGELIKSDLMEYLREFGGQDEQPSAVEEEEVTTYEVDGKSFKSEEEAGEYCDDNEIDISEIEEKTIIEYRHVVRSHANYGRKIKSSTNFHEDKDAAERAFIQGLEWYVSEKNWDAPQYFTSEEDAEEERVRLSAECMGVDEEVFLSIERKQKAVDSARAARLAESIRLQNEVDKKEIDKYINIIDKIDGESYKQTESRLSAALPTKIEGRIFHKIIKEIRK
jgi:hypothetical protein